MGSVRGVRLIVLEATEGPLMVSEGDRMVSQGENSDGSSIRKKFQWKFSQEENSIVEEGGGTCRSTPVGDKLYQLDL